jgi:hypothetical protein
MLLAVQPFTIAGIVVGFGLWFGLSSPSAVGEGRLMTNPPNLAAVRTAAARRALLANQTASLTSDVRKERAVEA